MTVKVLWKVALVVAPLGAASWLGLRNTNAAKSAFAHPGVRSDEASSSSGTTPSSVSRRRDTSTVVPISPGATGEAIAEESRASLVRRIADEASRSRLINDVGVAFAATDVLSKAGSLADGNRDGFVGRSVHERGVVNADGTPGGRAAGEAAGGRGAASVGDTKAGSVGASNSTRAPETTKPVLLRSRRLPDRCAPAANP
jgi:hypothetical protein